VTKGVPILDHFVSDDFIYCVGNDAVYRIRIECWTNEIDAEESMCVDVLVYENNL